MPITGYTSFITPQMTTSIQSIATHKTSKSLGYLLNTVEIMANMRAILASNEKDTPLSRGEFVTSSLLLEMAVNNLQKVPASILGNTKAYNLDRNSAAHVLNLEYFIELHTHEGNTLRAQWLDEFFSKGQLFDQALQQLAVYEVITAEEATLFTEHTTTESWDDSIVVSSAAASAASAGGTVAPVSASTTDVRETYAASLPKLVDKTIGTARRATEASFSEHNTSLIQLLNYHLQLAQQVMPYATKSLGSFAEFSLSIQIIGNVSKILAVTGGMTPELHQQVKFLCFVRNEFAHSKTITEAMHFIDNDVYYGAAKLAADLERTVKLLAEIPAAELLEVATVKPVIEVHLVEQSLQGRNSISATSAGGPKDTSSSAGAAAGGAASSHPTADEMSDDELIAQAIAENELSDSSDDETALTLQEKFDTLTQQKIAAAENVFELLRQIYQAKAQYTKDYLTSQLEEALKDPHFDINQTVEVQYTPPSAKAQRGLRKKIAEERDYAILERIVKQKPTDSSAAKTVTILPVNILLMQIDSEVRKAPLFKMAKELFNNQSLALEYMDSLDTFTNPCLTNNIANILEFTEHSGYLKLFASNVFNKYSSAIKGSRTTKASKYFTKTLKEFVCAVIALDDVELYLTIYGEIEAGSAMIAGYSGSMKLFKYALENSDLITCRLDNGNHTLSIMAKHGIIEALELLIKAGAVLEAKSSTGFNALHDAASNGHPECIIALLEAGANVEAISSNGFNALHLAAEAGNAECVQILVKAGANMVAMDSYGYNALHIATITGNVECIKKLVEEGADIETRTRSGDNALYLAADKGQTECVVTLLELGADIKVIWPRGNNALHMAAARGNAECVQLLIKAGADIKVKDINGYNALEIATMTGHAQCVELLQNAQLHLEHQAQEAAYDAAIYAQYENEGESCYEECDYSMVIIGKEA